MMKMLKKILALLFLSLFFAGSFTRVSAEVTAPDCTMVSVLPTTVTSSTTTINVSFNPKTGLRDDATYHFAYSKTGDATENFDRNSDVINWSTNFQMEDILAGPQSIYLEASGVSGGQKYCQTNIVYDSKTQQGIVGQPGMGMPAGSFDLCKQAGSEDRVSTCNKCLTEGELWTGVGCIPFSSTTKTVQALISIGLGITGTVVVLMTLYAGFMFSTSQGDPKRVDEAKAAVTSALAGAFFFIFSVTILRFIGVTVLRIPGFG